MPSLTLHAMVFYSLLALLAGALVYSVLAIVAARNYRTTLSRMPTPLPPTDLPPISMLTPLAGRDLGLEDNLRSSFAQDYPHFELVFAVREAADPAAEVVRSLQAQFPTVPAQLIITGEPPCPNAKVYSLTKMTEAARYDLLVMNDSDIRSKPEALRAIAAEFADPRLSLATCPYVAVAGPGWPARLEALMMNTHFFAGVLVARMLEGMKFALGPSAVVRRSALEAIGGWKRLESYLAEDFMLGKLIAETGAGVILSTVLVEHHIGNAGLGPTMAHRLRWCRSTRRSRRWGYIGELFTYPVPLAALLLLPEPGTWPLFLTALGVRYAAGWAVAGWALRGGPALRDFWAAPLQDLIGFAVWVAGFFGNQVTWRGRTYDLYPDGRFELAD